MLQLLQILRYLLHNGKNDTLCNVDTIYFPENDVILHREPGECSRTLGFKVLVDNRSLHLKRKMR